MKLVIFEIDSVEVPVFVTDEDSVLFDNVVRQDMAYEFFKANPDMQPRVASLINEFLKDMGIHLTHPAEKGH